MTSQATAVSPYAPDEYERKFYYNGITNDGDHPILIYRSDYNTTKFPKPSGRFASLRVKSLRGVFDTPLNEKWLVIGPAICDFLKALNLRRWSIDPARFFTHAMDGGEVPGNLGPVVIWIGVMPGSTSAETAHKVSQKILALLHEHGIDDVVVEFREAETQQLVSPPLLRHVGTMKGSHHVRRFLTALLGVPLTIDNWREGTLTLWFHENRNDGGDASDRVLGLSCCHVLRCDTTTNYELEDGALKKSVCVCGWRRFQRGLNDITKAIEDLVVRANYNASDIARLQVKEDKDEELTEHLSYLELELRRDKRALDDLKAFHHEVTKSWVWTKAQRDIGFVGYAPAISVANDTHFTSDWGVFVADEAKVRPGFEGNVVDLGSKYSRWDLASLFHPAPGGRETFEFPIDWKLRIVACATEEDLAHPVEFDAEGQRCLMVGKDGNSTDLTVGRYAGIVSFLENDAGVVSRELGIYNSGLKVAEPFSDKGDSGSLVWYMQDGKARMVGQLHSGRNIGQSSSNHVTYATPAWYLLEQVKAKYKHADFYRSEW